MKQCRKSAICNNRKLNHDRSQLNERIGAVEEILHGTSPVLSTTQELLGKLPDLEKGLCKIHYAKVSNDLSAMFSSLRYYWQTISHMSLYP